MYQQQIMDTSQSDLNAIYAKNSSIPNSALYFVDPPNEEFEKDTLYDSNDEDGEIDDIDDDDSTGSIVEVPSPNIYSTSTSEVYDDDDFETDVLSDSDIEESDEIFEVSTPTGSDKQTTIVPDNVSVLCDGITYSWNAQEDREILIAAQKHNDADLDEYWELLSVVSTK